MCLANAVTKCNRLTATDLCVICESMSRVKCRHSDRHIQHIVKGIYILCIECYNEKVKSNRPEGALLSKEKPSSSSTTVQQKPPRASSAPVAQKRQLEQLVNKLQHDYDEETFNAVHAANSSNKRQKTATTPQKQHSDWRFKTANSGIPGRQEGSGPVKVPFKIFDEIPNPKCDTTKVHQRPVSKVSFPDRNESNLDASPRSGNGSPIQTTVNDGFSVTKCQKFACYNDICTAIPELGLCVKHLQEY